MFRVAIRNGALSGNEYDAIDLCELQRGWATRIGNMIGYKRFTDERQTRTARLWLRLFDRSAAQSTRRCEYSFSFNHKLWNVTWSACTRMHTMRAVVGGEPRKKKTPRRYSGFDFKALKCAARVHLELLLSILSSANNLYSSFRTCGNAICISMSRRGRKRDRCETINADEMHEDNRIIKGI